MRPGYLSPADIPETAVEEQRGVLAAQAAEEGKPPAVAAKVVAGRLRKWEAEVCLTRQAFVVDEQGRSVEEVLGEAGVRVERFVRLEVGEGVEAKGGESFDEEVRRLARG